MEHLFVKLAADGVPLSAVSAAPPRKEKTLLQMMEQSVGDNEALKNALRVIRSGIEADKIDENSFEQIYARLIEHDRSLRDEESKGQVPPGALKHGEFRFSLEKELLRAKRHDLPLSALSFSILNVRLSDPDRADRKIRKIEVLDAAYRQLLNITRASDIIGELNQNAISMILPMTDKPNADLALKRIRKLLNDHLFEISGVRMYIILAGSAAAFLPDMKPNVDLFMRTMAYELEHTVSKIKYVQGLK
jgi:hypothetical protein